MKIAVDAMGGDKAPIEIVKGAVEVGGMPGLEVILVGPEDVIERELRKYPIASRRHITVHNATEVVAMGEHCANAIRSKPDSSIVVCANLVQSGEAEGMFTAGNTGAAMSVATLRLGRIRGIDRPAIAAVLPMTNGGKGVLLDAGANVDCSVENLLQFALMGDAYARVLGIEIPRIATLNIGEEYSKGNDLTKKTNDRLSEQKLLDFRGNLDAKHIFDGKQADVCVCDGFVGNIVLKIAEATGEFVISDLKANIGKTVSRRIGGALMRPAGKETKAKLSYDEYGGAPLLGVNGICFIGHGRSNPKAVANGISAAARAVRADLLQKITMSLAA